MGIVDVLGIGESVYLHEGKNLTFGVNDIFSLKPVDYLVCVDRKARFTAERLRWIEGSTPKMFFSQLWEWSSHPKFELIELQGFYPGNFVNLDAAEIPKSCFSPYVAVALAWKMFRPKTIRLFGVDMRTHKQLRNDKVRIQKHWLAMKKALEGKGCKTEVFGQGILTEI